MSVPVVAGQSCRIYASGTGQTIANGSLDPVTLNAVDVSDPTGLLVPDVAGGSSITVGADGTYEVAYEVKFGGGTAGQRYASLWVDGDLERESGTGSASSTSVSGAAAIQLTAGAVVTLKAYADGGSGSSIVSSQRYETGLTLTYQGNAELAGLIGEIVNFDVPTPGTLYGTWAGPLNDILNLLLTVQQAFQLALGWLATIDDETAVAARMPGVAGMRRLVIEAEPDEGGLWIRGVEDTEIVNVFYVDDYLRAPIAWIQNAGGFGINDRVSLFRNILGTPGQQLDIYGYFRRNSWTTFVWDGPPGNMLSHPDACQEGFEGSRSATLGTWQPAVSSCTLALHSESVGVQTPSGSFSSIRATATGSTIYAVTGTNTSGYPVVAGSTYSAVGNVRRNGANARNAQMGIQWFNSGGSFISQAYGSASATTQGAWVSFNSGGLVAPVGAAYASPIFQIASAASETFDLAAIALYPGTQTVFSPPFVGSGTYGTWGQAAAGDGWVRKSTGEAWVCTTGGIPSAQVWEQVATRLSSSNPSALGSVSSGSSALPARYDHVHPTTGLLLTTNLSSSTPAATSSSGSAGASTDVSRADHVHVAPQLSSSTPSVLASASAAGSATDVSKSDHVHGLHTVWTSWTPTLTNITIGNGTITARYARITSTVMVFSLVITLGTTSSVTGAISVDLPGGITAVSASNQRIVSSCFDSSADIAYAGQATVGSSSLSTIRTHGIAGSANGTNPFTWANGDNLRLWGVIETS